MRRETLAVLSVVAILFSTVPIYGDLTTISTDKQEYQNGEIIKFSGRVDDSDASEPLSIIIRDSQKEFVLLETVVSDHNGSFVADINTNPKLTEKGMYSAQLYVDDVATNEMVYFDYSPDGSPITHTKEEQTLLAANNRQILEKIVTKETAIVDSQDNPIQIASTGVPVQISSDLTNTTEQNQSFTYLVQITDSKDLVILISWISGMVSSDQTFDVSVSWIPKDSGTYYAEVFVWDSINISNSLSESETITIQVM